MGVRKLAVGSVELAVEEAGSGKPILLLHAGIATRQMWDEQWTWLSQAYRTIRFDMRGYGESTSAPGRFSATEDAVAVLDKMTVDSAIVMGCSYGGATAIHLALTHPEKIKALVLVASGVHGYQDNASGADPDSAIFEEMDQAWSSGDYERVLDLEEKAWIVGLRRTREQMDADLLRLCRDMNRTKLQWENPAVEYVDDAAQDAAQVSSIQVPTLVIVGDEDVPVIQRQAKFLSGNIPNAEFAVLHDVSHLPNLERPEAFDAVVRPWLARISD